MSKVSWMCDSRSFVRWYNELFGWEWWIY